jgi:hypothetical protein
MKTNEEFRIRTVNCGARSSAQFRRLVHCTLFPHGRRHECRRCTLKRAAEAVVAVLFCLGGALHAQDQPLGVRGIFTTGFYSTSTRGDANQSLSFVPFGAKFEMTGYYLTPDLLNFSAQPELNAGPQASEAGFQGGNGIQIHITFLRKLIPLTFRYSNIQVEDVYFGSLSQVSGYSLKNRNKDLGVTWELKFRRLPEITADWGTASVNAKSSTVGIPDYLSASNHINVDGKYERGNWVFDGFAHHQRQDSDLLEPIQGGTVFGALRQTVDQYQVAARRGFWSDSELYVNTGRQLTSSLLFTLPIDLNTHYAGASLRLMQKRRVRTLVRANYSSNIASQLLQQAASSLAGANVFTPDVNVLAPFSRSISNYNAAAITSATLPYGFGTYGSIERSAILSSSQEGPLNASYFTTSGGVTYTHRMQWGSVTGEYGREFGLGSITGQSGTIQGQTFRAGVQRGSAGGLQTDLSVHGSDQSVHNAQPLSNKSISAEASVADRLFGDFSGRVGGGWQWGDIINSANEFRTNGYTFRAGFEHPRIQVSIALNDAASNSVPFYTQVLEQLGFGSVVLVPLRIIPSDFRAMSFTLHSNSFRRVELSASWTRSRQHLDGLLDNDFGLLNIYATYHFRKIQLQSGYIRSAQIFALYPSTRRGRFYVRVSRSARLL